MTTFEIRLNELLVLFEVSNKDLANALNVDPSLVSRWKNGKRFPSIKYNQMHDIALFFINLKPNKEQRETIQNILAKQKLLTPHESDPTQLLALYLSERRLQARSDLPSIQEESSPPIEYGPTNGHLHPQNAKQFLMFQGNEGKRKGTLLLLQKALKTPSTDIYVYSDENLDWWSEDIAFQKEWGAQLNQLVKQNHTFHIIHNPSEEYSSFSTYLFLWLSVHFSGNIRSYANIKYLEWPIKETIVVIKDQMVYSSRSTLMTTKENVCFIHEDLATVEAFESLFLGRLLYSQEIIHQYRSHELIDLLEDYINEIALTFDAFKSSSYLPSVLLPESVFHRFAANLPYQQRLRYLNLIAKMQSIHKDMFNKVHYRYFFPVTLLHQIQQNQYVHFDPIFFGNQTIELKQEDIISTLKAIIYSLEHNPFMEAIIRMEEVEADVLNLAIEQHELNRAFFTTNTPSKTSIICLSSNYAEVLSIFQNNYTHLLQKISPIFKDKNYVIEQVEKTIQKVQSNI